MGGKKTEINIDLRPAIYDGFVCKGAACRNTCCAGWRIAFNKKDYLKLRNMRNIDPALAERIRQGVKRIKNAFPDENTDSKLQFYAEMKLSKDTEHCVFHDEDGLCAIQRNTSEDMLPFACRVYPRKTSYTNGFLERSLLTSCEQILQLLWDHPEGLDFRSDYLSDREKGTVSYDENLFLLDYFADIRSLCIDVLQYRAIPLQKRIMFLGMLLQQLREAATPDDIKKWIEDVSSMVSADEIKSITLDMHFPQDDNTVNLYLSDAVQKLLSIKAGKSVLSTMVENIFKDLNISEEIIDGEDSSKAKARISFDFDAYKEIRHKFNDTYGEKEYFFENLAVLTFFTDRLPRLESADKMWESFCFYCNLMGFFKFVAMMSCSDRAGSSLEKLFDYILTSSRNIEHNQNFRKAMTDSLFNTDSASLGHMAVLLSQ